MTTKSDVEDHRTKRRLNRYGFDADPDTVRIAKSETELHVAARFIGALVLQRAGRSWDVEVRVNEFGDRVDLLDFGREDDDPIAVEFESSPTRETVIEKKRRYCDRGPCQEVLVLDLRDAPSDVDELAEWVRESLAGV